MTTFSAEGGSIEQAIANGRVLLGRDAAAAAVQARAILRTSPEHIDALRLLAAALRKLGHVQQAEQAELAAISASRHDAVLAEGVRLFQAGMIDEAEARFNKVLDYRAGDPVAHLFLGETAARRGAADTAEAHFHGAATAAPAYARAHLALARLLYGQRRVIEAQAALEPILKRSPHDPDTLRFKATMRADLGDHEGALAIYDALLERHPDQAALWISRGDVLRVIGRRTEAVDAHRRAIEVGGAVGRAWWSLASVGGAKPDDMHAMEAALARAKDDDDRLHLHFALGRAYAAADRFEQAFGHFERGNRIRRATQHYSPSQTSEDVARSRQFIIAEDPAARCDPDDASAQPVFILGMPRSGSTLVEQMLGNHPMIEATTELTIIPAMIARLSAEHGGVPWQDALKALPQADRAALGTQYLERASQWRRTDRPHFIDKLPYNWLHIGFIRAILPNARIVDVRRGALDCCVSNFTMLFAYGHPAAGSLAEIGYYYRDYVDLLRHVEKAAPGGVHRLDYAALIAEPEAALTALLAHLDLPYDAACLDFHRATRPVATASAEQVRRPLNRDGVDIWKNYAPWLGTLRAALGALADDQGADGGR